ncbi:1731_t:CDS:2 [Ambispora leptoticha]|uniref:1731_t:CDS:1 n=1 Tax=Ambispora leptoticha TaxID=144679 RepID=A0A9N9AIZ0_9GLOM|nr:1731_t:CDS:2 [Ambispora leptoticha]
MNHASKPSIGGESSTSSEDVYFEAIADEDNNDDSNNSNIINKQEVILDKAQTQLPHVLTSRRTRERLNHQHSSSFDSMGSSRFESVYLTPRDSIKYMNTNGSFEEISCPLPNNSINNKARKASLGIDNDMMNLNNNSTMSLNNNNSTNLNASMTSVTSSSALTYTTAILASNHEIEANAKQRNAKRRSASVGGDRGVKGADVGGNDYNVVKAAEEALNSMGLGLKSDQWFKTSNDLIMQLGQHDDQREEQQQEDKNRMTGTIKNPTSSAIT